MKSIDTIVFGYGAITSQLMTELSTNSAKILCVTNHLERIDTSIVDKIEIITPGVASTKIIEAKDAFISWRKIPDDSTILDWLNSSSINFQRAFHLSSASVYSEQKRKISDLEISENAFNKESPKQKLEDFLRTITLKKSANLSNLRIANAYGSILETGFVSSLLQAVKSKKPIELNYDLRIERDYIYISDIVAGVQVIVDSPQHYPAVNISTGIGITTEQLLETFESLGHKLSHGAYSRDHLYKTCVLNPVILSQITDWQPRQIAEGLRLTLDKY